LRQEFRELELLDNVMSLRYQSKLPPGIEGDCRNTIIHAFRECKGDGYVPPNVHRAIRWSKSDPFLESAVDNFEWQVLHDAAPKNTSKLVTNFVLVEVKAMGAQAVGIQATKRKATSGTMTLGETGFIQKDDIKKVKFIHEIAAVRTTSIALNIPRGTQWSNNSCAYDCIVSILYDVYRTEPTM
ncbi:hypothetical protein BD779DRAFT_1428885, partial [Infundibulicybe gibba]